MAYEPSENDIAIIGVAQTDAHARFDGPESCAKCHPRQYLEWRGSAHAYALVDPIFLACNKNAQEQTGGEELGRDLPLALQGMPLPAVDGAGKPPQGDRVQIGVGAGSV